MQDGLKSVTVDSGTKTVALQWHRGMGFNAEIKDDIFRSRT